MDASSRVASRIDFDERKRIIMPRTESGNYTAMTVPPKPVRGPRPPLYRDFENCEPGNTECSKRNRARASANRAILKNHGNDYMLKQCQRNNALNINSGRPDDTRDCDAIFPQVEVPDALGVRTLEDGSVPGVEKAPLEPESQAPEVIVSEDDRVVLNRIDQGLRDLLSYFR